MKRLTASLLALLLCLTLLPGTALAAPSGWAAEEVAAAAQAGLTTAAVTRDYQANITREQFCELVVKLYESLTGGSAQAGANPFQDTNNPEIVKAYTLGIVKGISETTFGPGNPINRQEICVMLVRCIDTALPKADVSVYRDNSFADKSSIAVWASAAVNYAFDNSIVQGVGENKVNPLGNTTCEQAILMAYRIYVNQQNLTAGANPAPAAPAPADTPLDKLVGTYTGAYAPNQGESALTLRVYKENDGCRADFSFRSLPGRTNCKVGSYTMDVTYDELTKTYVFKADEWVEKPDGYELLDLRGTLNGDVLSGTAPTAFKVSRALADIAQPLDEALGVYTGTYFNNSGEVGLTLTIVKRDGAYAALFDFKNLPGQNHAKEGSYYMNVTYSYMEDTYTLTATEWVDKPDGYTTVDLAGSIINGIFSGSTSIGSSFSVVRAG